MRDANDRFKEISSRVGDRILVALTSGDRGFLIYLRFEGDAGFHSLNPDYAGPVDAVIEYELTNGQRDEHPAAWAYPREIVMRAFEAFERDGERPAFIQWIEA